MRYVVALVLPWLGGCSSEPSAPQGEWRDLIVRLTPLHHKLGKPRPGDWLDSKPERGQTFAQYRHQSPIRPRGKRKVIYVQPLGPMSESQADIVQKTADFMGVYFNTKVEVKPRLPGSLIPKSAQRSSRGYGKQILTGHVMNEILRPCLPDDAAAYIAFTALDLWPGRGWNFVFGEASLRQRVGVWSLARNGDPTTSEASYRKCLLRTIKTATHETGHMFSIQHCIAFECNMCGSMTQRESDRHPLALCPQCVAKVCWACEADPVQRYRELVALCTKYGLTPQAAFYRRSIEALTANKR